MNITLAYAHLMLITLLALLSNGCTRGPNESPIEFEEKSTHHTENMTPEEWEAFKNKAIEAIIRKYTKQKNTSSQKIHVTELDNTPAPSITSVSSAQKDYTQEPLTPRESKATILHIPGKISTAQLPQIKTPPKKSAENTFEKVDRYSQLKIKPEETKGKQYKVPPNAVAQVQSTTPSLSRSPSACSYLWPTTGTITAAYGKNEKGINNGINIKAKAGTPVIAIERGKVIFVGAIKGMGKVVLVEHPDQLIAAYAQVGSISVRINEDVKKGQKIANILPISDNEGELHFELRKGTKSLNPNDYLPPR